MQNLTKSNNIASIFYLNQSARSLKNIWKKIQNNVNLQHENKNTYNVIPSAATRRRPSARYLTALSFWSPRATMSTTKWGPRIYISATAFINFILPPSYYWYPSHPKWHYYKINTTRYFRLFAYNLWTFA